MTTFEDEKLTVHLAYLQNTWAKIAHYKNRQWAAVAIHSTFFFVLLTHKDVVEFFSNKEWLKTSIVVSATVLSFLTLLFCSHLKEKIQHQRKVIDYFETTYPNHIGNLRVILGDVMSHDFGDKLVYRTISAFVMLLTALVICKYSSLSEIL